MRTYTISQLARAFGLSRSTLLYYDRIGLLRAPERTSSGYRVYTGVEYDRLARISMFRGAGMALADVQALLDSGEAPGVKILERHLKELEAEILSLRQRQHTIIGILKTMPGGAPAPVVDKKMWVTMLEAAGMDEAAMAVWHAEFEERAPESHFEFLLSLGISREEAEKIQAWSHENCKKGIQARGPEGEDRA
ncbi:MerR family transcriptional regulator [Desulfoluna spongiiphila]|uniref:Transcriptional regulator, MerR family n=1 Tax=Desulfoluna spongiiphila TaxID=419481 RepID=A0A1G5CSJ1_9BACT|nr:MerR family transcriptional regulator [Desulfoluna spongiiphila]SCY05344.1 transcriptional regulator, MerR family [Desulfoluna spongiiphila]